MTAFGQTRSSARKVRHEDAVAWDTCCGLTPLRNG